MDLYSTTFLEFDALKELLARFLASPLGRAELERVAPMNDRARLEAVLAETREAVDYNRLAAGPQNASRGAALPVRFTAVPDVTAAVQKLRIEGATLDGKEIYDVTALLSQADDLRAVLTSVDTSFPLLAAKAAQLGDFRGLRQEIEGTILPDGTVADTASVALNRLRRDIERQKRHIQESLERFLRSHQDDGTLQEEIVTIRNDRFVVPVVSGQRRRIDGVIHSASGTGRTLFVEPLETIDLNNELVRLADEELREVHRILRELSGRLRSQAAPIAISVRVIGELELLFAKAQFAGSFDCVVPVLSPEEAPRLVLHEARHPLLADLLRQQRKPIVPISLELDERTPTLLISGPNTGGKTVAMKTAGLLALMSLAGLPVPATALEFPLFDQVLADIGDNQSIQESLSSFSAHVARIREIEAAATFRSLVLLDELGRATDPEEGGALGVAILDQFRMIGTMTLASTHLLALKVYGANTRGVLNGSMGFDEETLLPTYQLRLGAPGKSAGLDIASRLGLPPAMIERARGALSTTERDISYFLQRLHEQIEQNQALEAELRAQQVALTAREQALERDYAKREAAKLRELEQRTAQLTAQFEEQGRRAIAEITQLAEQRKAADQAVRKIAKTTREFRTELQEQVFASATPRQHAAPALAIEEGVRVRLKNVRELARVRRKLGDGRLEVEAGLLKLQVSLDDVTEVLPPAESSSKLPRNISFSAGPKWDITYREINVIGQRADEATGAVDKFLDDASLASVDRVRVVHGFGMGVLRKAVGELLSRHPHVEKFYPAPPSEGGAGATVVELKGA